jgi:hypothetical protein
LGIFQQLSLSSGAETVYVDHSNLEDKTSIQAGEKSESTSTVKDTGYQSFDYANQP